MATRVIICDDHALVRDAIAGLLAQHEDISVVGEASAADELLRMVDRTRPDVVVLDIAMKGTNGIQAARQIARAYPHTKVLAVSMHAEREFVAEMLKAGASGYLVKDDALQEVLEAVRTVATGGTYLSPGVAGVVVEDYVRRLVDPGAGQSTGSPLSRRELEVLRLIAEGCTTKEIASRLGVSIKTVETHRRRLMDKTGIFSVVGLTKYALRLGLTSLDK